MSHKVVALRAHGLVQHEHALVELEYFFVLVELEYADPAVLFRYEYGLRVDGLLAQHTPAEYVVHFERVHFEVFVGHARPPNRVQVLEFETRGELGYDVFAQTRKHCR